jgi:deoxyribonuclease-1-like protein
LGKVAGLTCAVTGLPTDTRGTHQLDHIIFHSQATTEFTGRSGVCDFLREYNLSMEEALEISDHLPVWAEFSVYEGGQPGRIAARPDFKAR